MDIVQFATALYKTLQNHEDDLAEYMKSGGVQSFDQYRGLVGEIQGLSFAREEIKALLEKSEEDVEELLTGTRTRRS
jgi:hypothetical protein